MAVGTKTHFLVAFVILVSVIVLLDIGRTTSYLISKLPVDPLNRPQTGSEGEDRGDGEASANGGDGGSGGAEPGTQVVGSAGVVIILPENPPGNGRNSSGKGHEEARWEGGGDGPVAAPAVPPAPEDSMVDFKECRRIQSGFGVVPGKSWGGADLATKERWALLKCDDLTMGVGAAKPGGTEGKGAGSERTRLEVLAGQELPIDCTERPSLPTDPLIAVCAGSTTRKVENPGVDTLALFTVLLPSLQRTLDCGFNYVTVVGYDEGDVYFDREGGREEVSSWFEAKVSEPAAARGIKITLELVRVHNEILKPGPVFTVITQAAYKLGANYTYRVNDDSEMVNPWAQIFVQTLEAMGPPYGVVGPESGNALILVHDFTHRLHMDIFDQQYYPATLTDWFVDDWISRIYGNSRTIRASNCKVIHQIRTHGQRYKEDRSKKRRLPDLVKTGAERIAAWASAHEYQEAAAEIRRDRKDGSSAKRENSRRIP